MANSMEKMISVRTKTDAPPKWVAEKQAAAVQETPDPFAPASADIGDGENITY